MMQPIRMLLVVACTILVSACGRDGRVDRQTVTILSNDDHRRSVAQGQLVEGVRQGVWLLWVDSGRPPVVGKYVDGLEVGQWERHYENGRMECQGPVKGGVRDGFWQFWHKDGTVNVALSGEYREGIRVKR